MSLQVVDLPRPDQHLVLQLLDATSERNHLRPAIPYLKEQWDIEYRSILFFVLTFCYLMY